MTVASSSIRHTFGRDDDRISVFSSRGPTWHDGFAKPGVAAPGQSLVSVMWSGVPVWGQQMVWRTSDPGGGSHIVWGNVALIANNNGSPPGRRLARP